MRTKSICGLLTGLSVAGYSIWRWSSGLIYDSPFRTFVGLFFAFSIMAWAYLVEWMTMKDKENNNEEKRITELEFWARQQGFEK